jgi:molybdopterin-containing oxidoreductase family iron-sulfur binding subunit
LQPELYRVADYATLCFDGFDFANLLVKTREGRPIKIDNNTITGARFSANARIHASILSLYDNLRLKQPKIVRIRLGSVDAKLNQVADAK